MANWNAGAGFANSFLQTLQGLTAAQNAQMQNARLANAIQREAAYENAVAEETNKAKGIDIPTAVQQGVQFKDFTNDSGEKITAAHQQQALQSALANPNLSNEERLAALKGYAGTEYATPTDKSGIDLAGLKSYQTAGGETKFNQLGKEAMASDINRSVRQRMLETGNIAGQERALHMGKLTREDEAAQAEMDFSNWMNDNMKLIQQDPTKWVQNNLTGYNKAGKGSFLDDGMTGKVVTSADGKTASFVQQDKKGKTVVSTPITTETAMQGLQAMAFDRFQSMPGKFKEAFTMGMEREKLGETKRHNRAIEGIVGTRAAGGGAGGVKGFQQKVNDYSTLLFQSGQTNPKTGKPFTEAEAKQHTMAVMLKDTGLVGTDTGGSAVKSLGEGLVQVGRQVYQQDQKTGEWVPAKGLPGSGPDQYTAVLGGKDIDTSRPGTPAAPAAPQRAIPTAKPDLSNWTMKPAGKTMFGETDYVLTAPNGTRMSLGDFVDRYGYNPSAEFIGRR